MTIVFLCPYFYPKPGGVEKHVLEVARRLSKKGIKIIVIAEGERDEKIKFENIIIHKFYFGKNNRLKKFRIWKKLFINRNLIGRANIIHCHDVFFWYIPFRFLYLKKKVYTTFHGWETKFPPSNKAIFIRKLSEKLSFGNICVGDYIGKWYGTKSTFVTYGGVNGIKNLKIKNKKKKSKLKIIFVGRVEEDNGISIYSEALKKLKKYNFEVCGDGSLRGQLEKFGKLNGFVKNVDKYILKSDIVFASSYLSILESLNLRKPVFSVYTNNLKKDYLQMSPFSKYISINSTPQKLVNAIKSYRRTKSMQMKLNLGYEWSKKQTWNNLTNLYLSLYKL